MTGRELIIYILQNHLEDEPIIKGGKFVGFMTVAEAATMFNVGEATIYSWIQLGLLNSFVFPDTLNVYIPRNAADPRLVMEV